MNVQKGKRTVNCVHCLWAHGSRSGKKCDTGAKGRSTTDEDEFSEIAKTEQRVDCLWAHGSRSGKKCDPGRQRQKQSWQL